MEKFEFKIADYFAERTTRKQPGFALSLVKEGEQIFSDCYGYANLEHKIKVDTNTVFYLCSLSKQFTATCFAFLLQAGKLSLDDALLDHFPSLPQQVYGPVRLKHLVHMCSGIREWYDILEFSGSYANEYTWRESVLPLLTRQESLSFQPGSRYIYCNTNYVLLTLIIEKLTGLSIAAFAKAKIFQPLGMKNSFYTEDNTRLIPRLAAPYLSRGRAVKKVATWSPLLGAGGVYSTLNDMVKWLKVLINEDWETDIIRTLKQQVMLNDGTPNPYLMGLEKGKSGICEYIQHGGAVPGYFNYIRFYPKARTGYVWLQNSHDVKPIVINCQLHGQLLDQKFIDGSECENISGSDKYDDFSGDYVNIATGKAENLQIFSGRMAFTNSAETFSNLDGPVFYSDKCIADMVILEEYQGLKLMRHIMSIDDQFFLKSEKLPEAEDILEYEGSFRSKELDITYKIAGKSDRIIIEPIKKFRGATLKMIAEDIFLSPEEGIKLRFERNEEGKIRAFFLDSFRSMNYYFRKL